jgi:hypothetical protein
VRTGFWWNIVDKCEAVVNGCGSKSNSGSGTIPDGWSVIGQLFTLILDKEELVYECYEPS